MILDSFNLSGKVALVTGASRGIGAAIAAGLAEAGADVACHGNSRDPHDTGARVEQSGRRSLALTADLGDRSTPGGLVERTIAHFGRLDILVNNAGTCLRKPALEFPEEYWDVTLAVNLTSAFLLSQLAARHMVERGSGGKILNLASALSFQGGVTVPAYAASKGGIAQLTKALANEWAARGINVNALAPGYIRTDNNTALQNDPVRSRQILERIPAGRWGDPRDLVGAAVFLCSAASDYMHGSIVSIDGGWLAR
jgi:2-deoxy-D-gluconate 3-dehydrogenase